MNLDSRKPFNTFLTLIGGSVLLVVGLAFSLLLFAFLAAAGLVVWAYVWWRTRALRRQMREQMQHAQANGYATQQETSAGIVIEGEVIREDADASTPRLKQ